MSIYDRIEALLGLVHGQVPEALEEVAQHCAAWRATVEIEYNYDDRPGVFSGQCYSESDDLRSSLAKAFPELETTLGEFYYAGAILSGNPWHVALMIRHGGEWWLCDLTADQFVTAKGRAPRFVFGRFGEVGTAHLPVPEGQGGQRWPAPWLDLVVA